MKNQFLKNGVVIQIRMLKLDDRLLIYERDRIDKTEWAKTCGVSGFECMTPYNLLNVLANGDVVMCELDWKYKKKFGNLYKDDYETIFRRKTDCYNEIQKDDCEVEACLRCGYIGGLKK